MSDYVTRSSALDEAVDREWRKWIEGERPSPSGWDIDLRTEPALSIIAEVSSLSTGTSHKFERQNLKTEAEVFEAMCDFTAIVAGIPPEEE